MKRYLKTEKMKILGGEIGDGSAEPGARTSGLKLGIVRLGKAGGKVGVKSTEN